MTAADPRDGLLPCPFCGGHPRLDESRITQGFSVHCPNCDACGGWQEGNSADQTIAAWNRRIAHARPEAVAGVALTSLRDNEKRCEECGRAVWNGVEPRIGWWAPCGNLVARIEDCGKFPTCVEPLTPERAP